VQTEEPVSNEPWEYSLVWVAQGTFGMGSIEGYSNEKPVHTVTLPGFYIGKYEITQKQWKQIMGANPSGHKNCDNCPVENVSYSDVQKFIKKLNQKTGKRYRLPTEAEWEFAARGGTKTRGYRYAGSDNLASVGWFSQNSNKSTKNVGQKTANELGIYDMSGNVFEWCSDWYDEGYYEYSPNYNPKGPTNGSSRSIKGGSYFNLQNYCRSAYRNGYSTTYKDTDLGFRLASE
jgi:formylglycine-generating enzyme required for sulfatase activity